MGCGTGKMSESNRLIDEMIKEDRKQQMTKLLLLGTGDSGKSTFARQMKVIFQSGFGSAELQKFASVLRDNTLAAVQTLISEAKNSKKIHKKYEKIADRILQATEIDSDLATHISKLWQSKDLQDIWNKCNKIQISSNSNYLMDNVIRISQTGFIPTPEDVFRAKIKTTGIVETTFEARGKKFLLVDVGGQRTERRKWLHTFEGVTAIIFLVAIDEYDMTLAEDNRTNRMTESLRLFGEITNSEYFKETTWILFLNKIDIFATKLRSTIKDFEAHFPEYKSGPEIKPALEYIQKQYELAFKGNGKLHVFGTCAIDTNNIDKIFNSVQETILVQNLNSTYFS